MKGPLLGREPVVTVSTAIALLIALLPALGLPDVATGAVSAALVAIGGTVSAALVSVDRLLPLLVGVGKAVLAAVATFGIHLPGNWISALMAVLTVVSGFQVRQQVVPGQAPQWKGGQRVGAPVADEIDFLAPRHLSDAPPLPDDRTEVIHLSPNDDYAGGGVFDYDAHQAPHAETQHGEHERGGEGRHALREWVTGRLHPDTGV